MESDKNEDGHYGSYLMNIKDVCSEYKRWGKKECVVSLS